MDDMLLMAGRRSSHASSSLQSTPRDGPGVAQQAINFAVSVAEERRQEALAPTGGISKGAAAANQANTSLDPEVLRSFRPLTQRSLPRLGVKSEPAVEHLSCVFSTNSFTGIKSLPNALHPDFRERLLQEAVQLGKLARIRQRQLRKIRRGELNSSLDGPPRQVQVARGQQAHSQFSAFHKARCRNPWKELTLLQREAVIADLPPGVKGAN